MLRRSQLIFRIRVNACATSCQVPNPRGFESAPRLAAARVRYENFGSLIRELIIEFPATHQTGVFWIELEIKLRDSNGFPADVRLAGIDLLSGQRMDTPFISGDYLIRIRGVR